MLKLNPVDVTGYYDVWERLLLSRSSRQESENICLSSMIRNWVLGGSIVLLEEKIGVEFTLIND